MKFSDYCIYLDKVEHLSSRNEITEVLAEMLGKLSAQEVAAALYLFQGKLVPRFESLEFNLSTKLGLRALDGLEVKILSESLTFSAEDTYKQLGDVGLVTEERLGQLGMVGKSLTILEVHAKLVTIAEIEGAGSQGQKIELLQSLLRAVSPVEGRFIGRIVVGKLRLGVSDKTMLDALSWYKVGDKSLRKFIEEGYGRRSDIGLIAEMVLTNEIDRVKEELHNLHIKPGIPVASKLVERVPEVSEVFDRMQSCIVQPKLDGLRTQIHISEEGIEIFSRNMERLTDMFPDLCEAAIMLNLKSAVIDSETIGIDPETGEYLEFQKTIQRKRKHGVKNKSQEIPITAQAFDILFLDGNDISREPLEERVSILREILNSSESNTISLLDTVTCSTLDELELYFEEQVNAGLEGVIVKRPGTFYEPGTRNYDWIKLKASMKHGMVDTVDAIVLGYYAGTGARSKFGIGALLVGLFDDDSGTYQSVAKVGTGISDNQFLQIKKDLDERSVDDKPNNYDIAKELEPTVYVKPEIIVVVEADEVTRSTMHTASKDEQGRGLSMRFPRLKVWNRKDKDVSTATTISELLTMSTK
ncbi:ATP-dependent DNA ligase [Candidatus Dojkabacteria bacterium]|uniref:DNA ligase (ATP) n=1 Tax=Candidatus Dojkabacteria bacterium TaxID=2099670 RepID=A0A955L7R6_9BACT|nr:ATP-dependent DNA ligase [Candidatus Dojkabacteria bacterium]